MHPTELLRGKYLVSTIIVYPIHTAARPVSNTLYLPYPVVTETWTVGFPLESSRWDAVTAEICKLRWSDILANSCWMVVIFTVDVLFGIQNLAAEECQEERLF